MTDKSLPIGVFDSGVGGISVLAALLKLLPHEKFIYFADSLHAPYGIKDVHEVEQLSLEAVNYLNIMGIKALVVACNTATSAAINSIRQRLTIPVIGMEPALKPAVELAKGGRIVVMATPMTLRETKFGQLMAKYASTTEIIPLPCPGLVELVEAGITEGERVQRYLKDIFAAVSVKDLAAIVLGCTHYLFVKNEIARLVGTEVGIVDGNEGTAMHLKKLLQEDNLLIAAAEAQVGTDRVRWLTSGNEENFLVLSQKLLQK